MFCFADDGGEDGYWWRQVGSGGLCVLSRDGESSRVCVCVCGDRMEVGKEDDFVMLTRGEHNSHHITSHEQLK